MTPLELLLAQALGLATPCPPDMVRVNGVHYEHLQRVCLRKQWGKCVAFAPDLVLAEPEATPVDVCMDRFEWPNRVGERPVVMVRFGEAESACAAAGKRLCSEFEWELACEGPERLPWPYGWERSEGRCNSDKPFRAYDEANLTTVDDRVRNREVARLWQGVEAGAFPTCASAFGVRDLVGNVEEWVRTSRKEWPHRSSLKGGYWSKPWTGCRGTNERHGGSFRYYQVGFRCCRAPQFDGGALAP